MLEIHLAVLGNDVNGRLIYQRWLPCRGVKIVGGYMCYTFLAGRMDRRLIPISSPSTSSYM